MANYSTVQALFDAGLTNMYTIVPSGNHSPYTTSLYPFQLSNYYFNGNLISNFAVSSNGCVYGNYINTSYRMIRYHDTSDNILDSLYGETGTLNGTISFFKLYWKGYWMNYGNTNSKEEWSVVFFSNGSICVHVEALGTYAKNRNPWVYFLYDSVILMTDDNPYATWYSQDSTGTSFTFENAIADFSEPEIKYLFKKQDGTYCTIVDGIVTDLSITELTASAFQNDGCSEEDLDETLVASIASAGSMDIYKWNSKNTAALSAAMRAVPTPKSITATIDVPTDATGLSSAVAVASNTTLWVVSLDGTTWKYWDAANNEWATSLVDEGVAMCSELANISASNWASFLGSATQFIFRFTLGIEDDELTSVTFTWA